MTQIPSYPHPPAGPPKQSGGGGPHAVVASINLTDPGGPGGGGGGSASRRPLEWKKKGKQVELDADTLKVGEIELAPPTLQAALSQLYGNGKTVDSFAFKKFLNELEAAIAFTDVEIPEHLLPSTEAEEIHLRELITDPRSGFAPEGLDAFDLESAEQIVLTPLIVGPGDFSEAGGLHRWSVLVLSEEDTAFDDLQRAAKEADGMKMNLLLSTSSNPGPELIDAIRNVGRIHPKGHIHVAVTSQG